jgi:MFS transporter, DHA2 family, multidrug resistance protein
MNPDKAAAIDPSALPNSVKFAIFGVMAFGQFMALIDIQIVAASLNEVQAGLSAAPEEISWVQTAYLIAELVMIPFAAYLAQAMSTRWLFAASAGLFTLSSALCGAAWNIESMTLFRAIQGFVGGAMVPTVFATGFAMFDEKQRAIIPALLGMVSVLAPTLGPSVGGWITDALGWRWVFYINVVPGVLVTFFAIRLIRVDRPNWMMLRNIDWTHLAAMAIFLGGLEYVLEEGGTGDWFADKDVAIAGWLTFVGFLLFLERSLYSKLPVVSLRPFRKPTFIFACVFNLVIGFGLYAGTYLVPLFLGRVQGYNAGEIGATVFIAGVIQTLGVPVAAFAAAKVDLRIVIAIGLTLFASGLWLFSFMTPAWGYAALFWPQAVRSFAIMLCIVPSIGLALTGFAGPELRYASGLFNLMRNLGWLIDYAQWHAVNIGAALGNSADAARQTLDYLTARLSDSTPDADRALIMAQAQFARIIGKEALTLAFNDAFRLMSWLFLAALVLVPFCRPANKGAASAAAEAH